MKIIFKILAVLCFQIAGYIAALLGYEIFKLTQAIPYTGGIWGLDIPYIYQTREIYLNYCLGLSVWFFLISVLGVIALLKRQSTLILICSLILIITLFLVVFFNGRYA